MSIGFCDTIGCWTAAAAASFLCLLRRNRKMAMVTMTAKNTMPTTIPTIRPTFDFFFFAEPLLSSPVRSAPEPTLMLLLLLLLLLAWWADMVDETGLLVIVKKKSSADE